MKSAKRRKPKKPSPLVQWVRDHWFRAWYKEKPRDMDTRDFWENLMRINRRRVDFVKVPQGIDGTLPGEIWVEGRPTAGVGNTKQRSLKGGMVLVVRQDIDEPYVDIDTPFATSRLTKKEWELVQREYLSDRPGDQSQ